MAAKRYLCATDAGYRDGLPPPSKHSLALQGGPMSKAERAAFQSLDFHQEAVRVRGGDDGGMTSGGLTPKFDDLRPLLQRVLAAQAPAPAMNPQG